jgi:hypothetical protein
LEVSGIAGGFNKKYYMEGLEGPEIGLLEWETDWGGPVSATIEILDKHPAPDEVVVGSLIRIKLDNTTLFTGRAQTPEREDAKTIIRADGLRWWFENLVLGFDTSYPALTDITDIASQAAFTASQQTPMGFRRSDFPDSGVLLGAPYALKKEDQIRDILDAMAAYASIEGFVWGVDEEGFIFFRQSLEGKTFFEGYDPGESEDGTRPDQIVNNVVIKTKGAGSEQLLLVDKADAPSIRRHGVQRKVYTVPGSMDAADADVLADGLLAELKEAKPYFDLKDMEFRGVVDVIPSGSVCRLVTSNAKSRDITVDLFDSLTGWSGADIPSLQTVDSVLGDSSLVVTGSAGSKHLEKTYPSEQLPAEILSFRVRATSSIPAVSLILDGGDPRLLRIAAAGEWVDLQTTDTPGFTTFRLEFEATDSYSLSLDAIIVTGYYNIILTGKHEKSKYTVSNRFIGSEHSFGPPAGSTERMLAQLAVTVDNLDRTTTG